MATPTLRHDQHHYVLRFAPPPPAPIAFATPRPAQPWSVTDDHQRADPVFRFRRATDLEHYPVLPKIASLLKSSSGSAQPRNLPTGIGKETMEICKRKLSAERIRSPMYYQPSATPRIVMVSQQREEVDRSPETRARCVSPSCLDWDHRRPLSAARGMPTTTTTTIPTISRRAVYEQFGSRGAAVSRPPPASTAPLSKPAMHRLNSDPTECRIYYQHKIHIPAEIPGSPHIYETHSKVPRKYAKAIKSHRQWSPLYFERHDEEIDVNTQKRRRLTPSPTPASPSRQPLYESECGLTILETSKPLVRSRYPPSLHVESAVEGDEFASRRRYVRTDSNHFENANAPISINYNTDSQTNHVAKTSTPRTPRTQNILEDRESTSLATLVLKSKGFLNSNNLVRNHHDEIDWVATFLNVGYDSSSIYALLCPLRKGRWKSEEENYTMGLLRLIENGTILLRHGQSIRGYIGEKLHSDDMRVLKKLSNCKMFHFAKLINPRLAEEEKLDMHVEGAREKLQQLDQLKSEFLRSVQLEALVAVRKHLSDNFLRELLNVRA